MHPSAGLLALCLVACQAPTSPERPAAASPAPPAPAAVPVVAPPVVAALAPSSGPAPRLVAVGDLHGDPTHAAAVLHMAGLIDDKGAWSGGDAVLVQTGDTLDRGPDSEDVLKLLMRLKIEAPKAGGRVVPLIGNHEEMNILGDWRYVSADDLAEFGGDAARHAALAPTGEYGSWILQNNAVVVEHGVAFAHGGISARFATQGAAGLSKAVRLAILGQGPKEVIGDEGPLWYRGYLLNDEPLACDELTTALASLGATRMVVGHTVQKSGKIAARCGGRLLGIDTGISEVYGAHLAALELNHGDARALYPSGSEDLPDP